MFARFIRVRFIGLCLLTSLLVQCKGCNKRQTHNAANGLSQAEASIEPISNKESLDPTASTDSKGITAITDEMIALARKGNAVAANWDFFADKLQALKDQGDEVDINEQNKKENYFSSLHYAALLGNEAIIQVLLDNQVDIKSTTQSNHAKEDQLTPLHMASQLLYAPIIELLINQGAAINAQSGDHETALDILIEKIVHASIDGLGPLYQMDKPLKRLLSQATPPIKQINIQNSQNNTLLHLAVQANDDALVALLLNKGADPTIGNKAHQTPFAISINKHPLPINLIQLFIQADKLPKEELNKQRDAIRDTILHMAVKVNAVDLVKTLLQQREIDVNAINGEEQTPLHIAVEKGNPAIIHALLQHEPTQVNQKDIFNRTPLKIALEQKPLPVELIKLLISKFTSLEINEQDHKGETLLHKAIVNKQEALVELLLGHANIDVNIQTKLGYTPLHLTIANKQEALVKLLLGHANTEVNIQTTLGYTPLHLTIANAGVFNQAIDIVQILLERGANPNLKTMNKDLPTTALDWIMHCLKKETNKNKKQRYQTIIDLLRIKGAKKASELN